MRRFVITIALAATLVPAVLPAIPAFARRYNVSCAQCHSAVPKLNDFGASFGANGFQFAKGEEPRDTVNTGDALLRLQRGVPLAVRFDSYIAALSPRKSGQNTLDLETPWVIKLLSGGPIADKVSYYTYFLLTERGEVAGLEDAYVQFNDVFGTKASLIVGQFQVSDPMFKRELRLSYDDYQLYRVRVGDASPDLTYDRGAMLLVAPWDGSQLTLQLLNGRGLNTASAQRQFDRDSRKNVAVHVTQDVGPLRVGAFGYRGSEFASGIQNTVAIWGPDVTVPLGSLGELNAQFLRRTDGDPFFGSCSVATPCPGGATIPFSTTVNSTMAELIAWPGGPSGRVVLTALYNRVTADRPVVSLRLGEQATAPGFAQRYETVAGGAHFIYRRNLRMMSELGYDLERKQTRLITGTVIAF